MCGSFLSWHCGHSTRAAACAFHCERRWWVLLRDFFRFGTATSALLAFYSCFGKALQCRPPGVGDVVTVVGTGVSQPYTALRAEAGTVFPAQRGQRKCEHHRVPEYRFEIEETSVETVFLFVDLFAGMARIDVDEEFLELHLHVGGKVVQAACALTHEGQVCRARDEHALHHRLEPEIQFEVGVLG